MIHLTRFRAPLLFLPLVGLATSAVSGFAAVPASSSLAAIAEVKLDNTSFNLNRPADLTGFSAKLEAMINQAQTADASGHPSDSLPVLKEIQAANNAVVAGQSSPQSAIRRISELTWSLDDAKTAPAVYEKSLDLTNVLTHGHDMLNRPIGRGSVERPALDILNDQPQSNQFWSGSQDISTLDTFHGFGRTQIPKISDDAICTYKGPKKSYGVHPGLKLECDHLKVSFKFGKDSAQGFGARMLWALGFYYEVADYASPIKVQWDPRILSEFNSEKSVLMPVSFGKVPVLKYEMGKDRAHEDPFNYIKKAVLKDGHELTSAQLKSALFPGYQGEEPPTKFPAYTDHYTDPDTHAYDPYRGQKTQNFTGIMVNLVGGSVTTTHVPHHPEDKLENFSKSMSAQIAYLVMEEGSVKIEVKSDQPKDIEVGRWSWDTLDHPDLRETRGLGLLSAWLGAWDMRPAQNVLLLSPQPDGSSALHFMISDFGAILGNAKSIVTIHGGKIQSLTYEKPNQFEWSMTRPMADGQTSVPVSDFTTIYPNESFKRMNMDDARWMARLIASLSERQIRLALIGSGYDTTWVKMYVEKLVNRRDQMIRDLGLSSEINPLRPTAIDRKFSYNSERDGIVTEEGPKGETVFARDSGLYEIREGQLMLRKGVSWEQVPASIRIDRTGTSSVLTSGPEVF